MEGEEEQVEGEGEKDCQSVEIGRVWNVGCVECEDMSQGICDSESEDEEELRNLRGEWEEMSRDSQDMDGGRRHEEMIAEMECKARLEGEQLMKQEED